MFYIFSFVIYFNHIYFSFNIISIIHARSTSSQDSINISNVLVQNVFLNRLTALSKILCSSGQATNHILFKLYLNAG
ncbi:hypothetical protein GW796_01025 [archaeon]|nr:hypothetical protein [archaeon]